MLPDVLQILLLEDSATDAELITRLLTKEIPGAVFTVAGKKKEFAAMLAMGRPDVILADNSIAGLDAHDALRMSRDIYPHIPFIMVTGTVSEEVAVGTIKAGADDYIIKDRLVRLPAAIYAAIEKRQTEKEKIFEQNNLRALINNTRDLMWSLDREYKLITFNDAFNDVIKLTSGEPALAGQNVLATQFSEELRQRYRGWYNRAFAGESFTITDHFNHPAELWSETSFYPIVQDGLVIGTACFSRDITERVQSEQALKKMEQRIMRQKIEEQKTVSRAIIRAQETERNRLGQELHDNINQMLVAMKIYFAKPSKDEKFSHLLSYPLEILDKTIEEIRQLSAQCVTPPVNINLRELTQKLMSIIKDSTETQVTLAIDPAAEKISDDVKINVFRIIQEQVNNMLKHAHAKNIFLSIHSQHGLLEIIMEDDGVGFDTTVKRKGIGLSNMINRVRSFNGEAVIASSPGSGCRITIHIPNNSETHA